MYKATAADDLASADEVGTKADLPCPACGGRDYAWGHLGAHGITFMPDDASWLARAFRYSTRLRARRCRSCGNIQAFA